MSKAKHLSKKQLVVLEDLFTGELSEQDILKKNNVSRNLYNRWLIDEYFADQMDNRVAAAYRRSTALIARHASRAAEKLINLTESNNSETARKACLDIISMPKVSLEKSRLSQKPHGEEVTPPFSADTAHKILEVLAAESRLKKD